MSWNPLGGLGPKPWILPPPAAAPSALPAPPRVGKGVASEPCQPLRSPLPPRVGVWGPLQGLERDGARSYLVL